MYVPGRSPTPSRSVPTAKFSKADKVRKAEAILEKLGDARAGVPVRKIRDGSASKLDAAILAVAEYLDVVKGGGK